MPTAKELDSAARQMEQEEWSPASAIKRVIKGNRGSDTGGRSRAEMEKIQLENEEKRNPEEFRKSKQLYEAGVKMQGMKKGGKVSCCKKMSKGGSASKRADGCAMRGKTKGRLV